MQKRFLTILLAISMVTASVLGLTACSKAGDNGDENAKEGVTKTDKNTEVTIESEIKTAYYNLYKETFDHYSNTVDDISLRFYGKYGSVDQDYNYTECYVMFIDVSGHEHMCIESPETIDGVVLNYSNSQKLDVYHDGEFLTVIEAFDEGLLYHSDLMKLAYRLEHPERLAIEPEIQKAYYELHKKEMERNSCAVDDIKISFYGKYGESYALFIDSIYFYPQAYHPVTIDGVVLHYWDYQELDVYNNGEIYTVQEAFENGLLTHDDLVDIAYHLEDKSGSFFEH